MSNIKTEKIILEVRNLSVKFESYRRLKRVEVCAAHDINIHVREGELVAAIGASGSGKSLLAHSIMGILPDNAIVGGTIIYDGAPLDAERIGRLRGHEIVLVPQGVNYLDPLMKVDPWLRQGKKDSTTKGRALDLLARFGLSDRTKSMYPFELSGGMARRVLISSALMETPKLVIADEPTPGLNAEIAVRVLGHFKEMADEGAGVLVITHDLEAALQVADRIVVFKDGATVDEVYAFDFKCEDALINPYTRALWRAMPQNEFEDKKTDLRGTAPKTP